MSMQSVFKFELDNIESENIKKFCDSVDYCAIEQSLGWTQMFFNSKICYFYLQDESGIRSFSQIHEKLRSAQIIFGPVCCDKEIMVDSINEIINYYKRRHFIYLGIQMYFKSGYETEYIEYKLNKLHKIQYRFNTENTKSSIELNLEDPIEEIYSRIRKGHKSDIKKAIKMGITVNSVKDSNDLSSFVEVYSKMCLVRKLHDDELSINKISDIYNYLLENRKGYFLIVKDNSGIVIGGAILVFQGISLRYYKGTTDPDRRDLPILHLLMYEAIKKAKIDSFKYFDFWGYNHFADDNDQVYNINHFKKGFGGYYTFFAKKMNIDLIPEGYNIYRIIIFMKGILKKILFR
jgi:lipid II:glycine glycyltransferase (peptidoglycan interpeptide bridge formation enzyme)